MHYKKCELCGLKSGRKSNQKRVFMTQFPLDEKRCKQWVKVSGIEDLVYVPIEKLHELKYVCGNHFKPKDFNRKRTRLKRCAIPSLHLKREPLPEEMMQDFPLHVVINQAPSIKMSTAEIDAVHHDHNYDLLSQERNHDCSASSVKISTGVVDVVQNDHNYDLRYQERTQDCPALSSIAVKTSTSEAHAIRHDNNELQFQNKNQDGLGSSSEDKISTSEVHAIRHDNNDLQFQNKIQDGLDLTPRRKELLKKLQNSKIKLRTLQKKVHVIESIESSVLKTLITSTVKNQNKKHQARRWSNSDKGLALSIYKKSPKAYRFLRHMMPLPSIRTLQTVLQKMPLEPGVNDVLLTHLRKAAQNLNEEDKICIIMFDEMALKKRFILNTAKDKIEGFEDLGELGRTDRVANHALVFMMQGLRKKYKQPLAHYFVQGTISTEKLTVLLKNVIRKVTAQGYIVIATVCDQGPTNVGALNLLKRFSGNNADLNYFILDENKIFTLYDVPHLFKSIRNNFLQAGELKLEHKKAKWVHLIRLEEKNRETLHFPKITKRAVAPKYKGKMKVKLAAQILSNTVAAVLKLQADSSTEPEKKELLESADIIKDLDHLFDLTNGPSSYKDIKKKQRENVKKDSFHHDK